MRTNKTYWQRMVALVSLVLVLLVVAPSAAARASNGNPNPGVLPPNSHAYGKTYGEWSAAWWQWAFSIPVHSPPFGTTINHPLFDVTGTKCSVGQSGHVWFLGGAFFVTGTSASTTISRACTVPVGKALYFPIVNTECSTLEGNGTTEQALRACAKSSINPATNLAAEVDRVAIQNLAQYRVQSPLFSFTLPRDNLLSAIGEGPFSPGTYYPAADDGYYLMLAPLPPGKHTVHFHAEIPAFDFTLDVTYNLTVAS